MKSLQSITLALVLLVSIVSCKKSNDEVTPPTTWQDKLKGSTWSGEFMYTTGIAQLPQPFSIDLNSDGTLTWTDVASTRPGGTWEVKKDRVIITFPSTVTLSASLHDGSWDDFTNTSANGFTIKNLYIAKHPDPAKLSGTSWSGTLIATAIVTKFLSGSMVEILGGTTVFYSGPYTVEGAGIKFTKLGSGSPTYYYACIVENSKLKGITQQTTSGYTTYFNWYGTLVK